MLAIKSDSMLGILCSLPIQFLKQPCQAGVISNLHIREPNHREFK